MKIPLTHCPASLKMRAAAVQPRRLSEGAYANVIAVGVFVSFFVCVRFLLLASLSPPPPTKGNIENGGSRKEGVRI